LRAVSPHGLKVVGEAAPKGRRGGHFREPPIPMDGRSPTLSWTGLGETKGERGGVGGHDKRDKVRVGIGDQRGHPCAAQVRVRTTRASTGRERTSAEFNITDAYHHPLSP
jgi:hypothetical protein